MCVKDLSEQSTAAVRDADDARDENVVDDVHANRKECVDDVTMSGAQCDTQCSRDCRKYCAPLTSGGISSGRQSNWFT